MPSSIKIIPVVAVAVINPQGHILFQKRRDNSKWTNPAGHLDTDETPEDGARRELLEETDLVPHKCEYIGSGSVPGKNILVHCFKAFVDGVPDNSNDPDKEVKEFIWVDPSQGIPPEILNNLHSPDNVLLKLLGLTCDVQKSESLQKAPASWNDPRTELEDFARYNLMSPSEQLKHSYSRQIHPNLWLHKYVESNPFKISPGRTRQLTEYRVTNNSQPSSDKSLAVLTGTAHNDKGKQKFRVSALAVDPNMRRHGLGKTLYSHMLLDNGGHAESDTLVSPDAQGLYEGLARDPKFSVTMGDSTKESRHVVDLNKALKHTLLALASLSSMHHAPVNQSELMSRDPSNGVGIQSVEPIKYSPAPPPAKEDKWGPEGLHPDLFPIAHLESSFGHNIRHAEHSKGPLHTAYGALGFKPVTAYERYKHDSHLQTMFPGITDESQFLDKFKSNHLFYNSLASSHWGHLKRSLGGDPHRTAYAWRWGIGAAQEAPDASIAGDPYVQSWDRLSNRLQSGNPLTKAMAKNTPLADTQKLHLSEPSVYGGYLHNNKDLPSEFITKLYNIDDDPLDIAVNGDLKKTEDRLTKLGFSGYSSSQLIAVFKKHENQVWGDGSHYLSVGSHTDGLKVGEDIHNQGSIDATLPAYTHMGIKELPLSDFHAAPHEMFYSVDDHRRVKDLANQIQTSGRIDPLIIATHKDGSYVIEGAHRLAALHTLGKKTFPAMVVRDDESFLKSETISDKLIKKH